MINKAILKSDYKSFDNENNLEREEWQQNQQQSNQQNNNNEIKEKMENTQKNDHHGNFNSAINHLITADQSGSIKLWDLRNVKNCIYEFVSKYFLFTFTIIFLHFNFMIKGNNLIIYRFLKKMFLYKP